MNKTEGQRTFGEIVDLPPVATTAPHPLDVVVCESGVPIFRKDAFYDVNNLPYEDEDRQWDANVSAVSSFLSAIAKSYESDYRENLDYADGYFSIGESEEDWKQHVGLWVEDYVDDIAENASERSHEETNAFTKFQTAVTEWVIDVLDNSDVETEYVPSNYDSYGGSGCCLYSVSLGEIEEEIVIDDHTLLAIAEKRGILEGILEEVRFSFDFYLANYKEGDYAIRISTSPGGQWRFVVSEERMTEFADEAMEEYL